jgi:hypothetical protein
LIEKKTIIVYSTVVFDNTCIVGLKIPPMGESGGYSADSYVRQGKPRKEIRNISKRSLVQHTNSKKDKVRICIVSVLKKDVLRMGKG